MTFAWDVWIHDSPIKVQSKMFAKCIIGIDDFDDIFKITKVIV